MKKLFFAVAMLFLSSSVMAQVEFENGSLKEAIAKAKADNKLIMVMGSATWWGPCKGLERNVFPTSEAGDFLNSKFIVKKYNLDKNDPDKIVETYKISGYPTFIILDGDGKEIARMVGAPAETTKFIEAIKNTLAKAKKPIEVVEKEVEEEEEAPWGSVSWE